MFKHIVAPPTASARDERLRLPGHRGRTSDRRTKPPPRPCGLVASATYAAQAMAAPTFLNLGKSYPNHVFSAVTLGSD